MTGPPSPVTFRVYVNRKLLAEEHLPCENRAQIRAAAAGMASRHKRLTDAADASGGVWLIEVFDPDETDYPYLRFGTDVSLMTEPRPAAEVVFTCPVCGAVSAHPVDIMEGYCGRCHDWTGPGRGAPS